MKINRASRITLNFITDRKRDTLYELMDEYSRVVNLFIDRFWGQELERKDLSKEVTNQPESWVSARARQRAVREALGTVQGAQSNGHEKPTHYGKKMTLSAQCVTLENGNNSFDWGDNLYVEEAVCGLGS